MKYCTYKYIIKEEEMKATKLIITCVSQATRADVILLRGKSVIHFYLSKEKGEMS